MQFFCKAAELRDRETQQQNAWHFCLKNRHHSWPSFLPSVTLSLQFVVASIHRHHMLVPPTIIVTTMCDSQSNNIQNGINQSHSFCCHIRACVSINPPNPKFPCFPVCVCLFVILILEGILSSSLPFSFCAGHFQSILQSRETKKDASIVVVVVSRCCFLLPLPLHHKQYDGFH